MATLLELLASLPDEAMREGESVVVVDGRGREATITFGARYAPPTATMWGITPPPDVGRWHQHPQD